jgi:tetratricopeptide (TPR) repeat protein
MSELCFLEGGDRELQQSYVNQALKVRPFAAQVLFVAGREAWSSFSIKMAVLKTLEKDDPRRPQVEVEAKALYGRAMAYWKGAFNRDVTYQQRITNLLIDYVTAKFMAENFQPDVDALQRLEVRFRELNRPGDHRVILYHYAVALIEKSGNLDNDKPIQDLLSAAHIFDQLSEDQKVLESYQAALKASPNSFKVRYTVGRWFFKREQYAEASKHLEWCLRLKQGDETLMKMVETSQRRSIALPINKTTRFK